MDDTTPAPRYIVFVREQWDELMTPQAMNYATAEQQRIRLKAIALPDAAAVVTAARAWAEADAQAYPLAEQTAGPLLDHLLAMAHALRESETSNASFTCPRCGRTSYHPDDIREGYCGHCHDWTRGST